MSETAMKADGSAIELSDSAIALLRPTVSKELKFKESLLATLQTPELAEDLVEPETFSGILEYAIGRGLIQQLELSKRVDYANSQIGRWAARKAAPPLLVRRGVLREIAALLEESIAESKARYFYKAT